MTVLYYVVTTLHVLFCLFLILVVLLQQGKGQDLASAFGGGGSQTAFGPRGSATVLSRATAIAAALFMVTSLALSLVQPKGTSVLDAVPESAEETAPATSGADEETAAPAAGDAVEAPSEATPAVTTPPTDGNAPTGAEAAHPAEDDSSGE
jgi:preprotein translocase subunit SecG